jgi:hypothetical protein
MDQVDPALAASFILRVQEQVRWLETRLVTLAPESGSFISDQLAITGAMNELRKLMEAEHLANDWQPDFRKLARRIQQEPDPQKMIELAQRLMGSYCLEKPLLVNALRNELTVIIGQCDMLEDALSTQAHPLARIKAIKTVALRMADRIAHQP